MADKYWVGSRENQNWSTPSNWQDLSVPIMGDDIIFDGRVYQSDCIVDLLANLILMGVVKFTNGVNITITLLKDTEFGSESVGIPCEFSADNSSCNVNISGPHVFTVNEFILGQTIGHTSILNLKNGVTLSANPYQFMSHSLLQQATNSIIPDAGTSIIAVGNCFLTGILGKANTAYNLHLEYYQNGHIGTLIAPNASGTFVCRYWFQSPHTFIHSNGKVTARNVNTIYLADGDLLNYFYDLEIALDSVTILTKAIVVSGTKTGDIISDQVSTGILTIEHDLNILGELHAKISSILLKNVKIIDMMAVR